MPADSPPSPFSAVVRLAADWMAGIGFLRFHAAAYAIAGAALLLIDLILNPSDPWAVDVLRVWLILLGSHAVGLVAGWVTWRAIRPHRLIELRSVWTDVEEAEGVGSVAPAGPPRPLPATGRFTPGRLQPASDADDEQSGLSSVLGALGDAVVEVGELALAGGARIRRGMSGVFDWIQGDDEDFDADEEPEVGPEPRPAQTARRSPAALGRADRFRTEERRSSRAASARSSRGAAITRADRADSAARPGAGGPSRD